MPLQVCWTAFGKMCLGSQEGAELQWNELPAEALCHSLEDIAHVLFFLVLCFKDASGTELWGPLCCWEVVLSCGGIRFAVGGQQSLLLVQPHSPSHPLAAK